MERSPLRPCAPSTGNAIIRIASPLSATHGRQMSKGDRYRRGVGVMLLNDEGKVFVGARIDNTDEAWQMPQGGIDKDEKPWKTALRELEEETGISPNLVERIAKCPE